MQVEVLPDEVFGEVSLATGAALSDVTYVSGASVFGNNPAVWSSAGDGVWKEHPIEPQPGMWGVIDGIVECDGDLVFTGHYSASNQVLDYNLWGFDESGSLVTLFSGGGGPPGSGTPPPAVYCHDGNFMALVTYGREPVANGDFTYYNEIWSSPTGSDWSLVATDTIRPAIRPRAGVGVVRSGSAFWVVSAGVDGDIATSSDGVRWTWIDREAAGFEPDDWIDTMGGGGLGLLVVGNDDNGDPVMWWTPDGRNWERIDDHPALDQWGVEILVPGTELIIAVRRSFEEGAPAMWFYFPAG
ncbi:MAG: hypothetical protein U9N84_14565 [Actinomycetota bacterium]|nr:hypothetical protein [Actinomycetota bacterium]